MKIQMRGEEYLMTVLQAPLVTEKAARISEQANQFGFKVRTDATKPEIAKAVEMMFSVEVERVTTVNIQGKAKRFGRTMGRRNGVKKAYVQLKAGQSIDLVGAN